MIWSKTVDLCLQSGSTSTSTDTPCFGRHLCLLLLSIIFFIIFLSFVYYFVIFWSKIVDLFAARLHKWVQALFWPPPVFHLWWIPHFHVKILFEIWQKILTKKFIKRTHIMRVRQYIIANHMCFGLIPHFHVKIEFKIWQNTV